MSIYGNNRAWLGLLFESMELPPGDEFNLGARPTPYSAVGVGVKSSAGIAARCISTQLGLQGLE